MIDEAARRRLGIDFGGTVTGTIPVKVATRIGGDDDDPPMSVEADLTPVKIDNLLPGWVKPAGKPAHATYTLVKTRNQTLRFDDLTIDGSGANVKGSIELDAVERHRVGEFSGVQPVGWRQGLAQGRPRQRRRAARDDARRRLRRHQFRQVLACRRAADKNKQKQTDLDLDIKLGTVVGHNGETLRGLDLKLTRRERPHPQLSL